MMVWSCVEDGMMTGIRELMVWAYVYEDRWPHDGASLGSSYIQIDPSLGVSLTLPWVKLSLDNIVPDCTLPLFHFALIA